jgi:hypothetical protein
MYIDVWTVIQFNIWHGVVEFKDGCEAFGQKILADDVFLKQHAVIYI